MFIYFLSSLLPHSSNTVLCTIVVLAYLSFPKISSSPNLQDIRRGLTSVRRICDQYKIEGVFGSLIELLECDDRFFTAVEVTAGNRYMLYLS